MIVEFGQVIDPAIHHKVRTLIQYLDHAPFDGFVEYVAAFASVTVYYDLPRIRQVQSERSVNQRQPAFEFVAALLQDILKNLVDSQENKARVVEVPVCYGGEFGPDLEYVAEHNHLTSEEVIAIHSGGEYLVYMIGFAPGFPYLGGMSERIAAPRRQTPRVIIPGGTVGIAGMQTGVYPIATPGGWQLIGRTPLELFCPQHNPPTLLQSGDIIKFRPISRQEYEQLKGGHQ